MRLLRVLPIFAVVAIAACGAKKPAPQVLHVDIRGMKYDAATLAVTVGDTVEWTNNDLMPHTVTSSTFDSKSIAPHGTWSYVASTPGEFAYTCTFHPTMVGTLTVR